MQIVLHLLFILQSFNVVQLNDEEEHFIKIIKRDVHSSSVQNLNRYTKTFENGQNIIFNTPNFTLINSLLSNISINPSKFSVCNHTRWLIRQISLDNNHLNKYDEIARYDSTKNHFILHYHKDYSCSIDSNTGQLTLINTNDENFLRTEISLHAESGLSHDDDILHDIYRLIRLSSKSINCTTNVTVNIDESFDITCTIEYEFLNYDDLDNYQPTINFTFYIKENDFMYKIIDENYLNEIKDIKINNMTLNWRRSIIYTIQSINKNVNDREYGCILIPDTLKNEDIFQDSNRICQIRINVENRSDLIDILILVFITLCSLLFIVSLILCLSTQQHNKKRIVQIKPENKTITLPLNTNTKSTFFKDNLFSNNNEIKSEIPLITSKQFSKASIKTLSSEHIHQHKPGCPKYIPSPEHNFLSNNLFTHTTIDNIKKIILPDIPQNNELFDDQTYIHFYIPSKTENISFKKLSSSLIEKDKSSD
ncbi:unnamed protein product [Rotaria sp. Silwood1]|nr:unnamed protein product [Rotaria sp. Silwood1]CAF4488902.1 unnamed protein product [Rotaria sp. Silwood1]CAF4663387.1 unnamed protein product [Rotaria sp. Silwood1]